MRVGQYAVIWSPFLHRPHVMRKACEIVAIGKRIKVDRDGHYNLLTSSEILAVFDDKPAADRLAGDLHDKGIAHAKAEREALQRTIEVIIAKAREASS